MRSFMVRLKNLPFISYFAVFVFLGCMVGVTIKGDYSTLLALCSLLIALLSTPFFTKDVELEKYREQLGYDKKYSELKRYYTFLSRFHIRSLRMKKKTISAYKKELNVDELLKEKNDYLTFVKENYDELFELCNFAQFELSIYMAPTNIAFLGGVNDFSFCVKNLDYPVTEDMINCLSYNYDFILEAKSGAYQDIRKILYLDNQVDNERIDIGRYKKLCEKLSPDELKKSKTKH